MPPRGQLQFWPIIPTHLDNGTSPTHSSYEWSPWRSESRAALRLGLLPEIQIWIGLPDENELVDFSTKGPPQQAGKDGLVWRTEQPPDFLWCGPSDLPEGVIYRPDMEAITFALNFIRSHRRPVKSALAEGTGSPSNHLPKR
jgi:hypothetical protein